MRSGVVAFVTHDQEAVVAESRIGYGPESALGGCQMESQDHNARTTRTAELLAEFESQLSGMPAPKTVLEQLRKSALDDLAGELRGLSRVLSTSQTRLVFIGQVGVGKTTAICHLVGLTADREKRKKNKAGVEKAVLVTEDLMATGSGFTTLCEVVVTPSDRTKFEVLPYERTEVEQTISDFCVSIWRKVYPETDDTSSGSEQQVSFPPELVRAVRNMVKLPEGERRDDDAAIHLAQKYQKSEFERFRLQVLGQAKLDARTVTELTLPPGTSDTRAWIKETFDGLNLARIESASIPRRITLHLDSKLLAPEMSRVAALIDTKGVDAAQFNREDLDKHIRGDDAALCILAERFENAPTNVLAFLQRHVTKEAPISPYKFVLMVLPRGNEPEKVVGGQGTVGDRDHGIELRRSQIEETLTGRGLPTMGQRLVFFDPLLHFEAAGVDYRLRSDSSQEDVAAARQAAWSAIFAAVEARNDRIWERVLQIGESLKKIREGKGLDPAEEELVREAKQKISEYRHLNLANADRFLELYRGLWEGGARHPMTLRATNNRFGVYPHRNIDIYYDAVPITEQLVRTAASRPKEAILEIIRDVRASASPESDLHEILSVLETKVDTSFEEVVRTVGQRVRDHLHAETFAPQDPSNSFWLNVQARYGKGAGYRDDVLSMYADQLDQHEEFLARAAEDCWRAILIEPILEYLG